MPGLLRRVLAGGRADGVRLTGPTRAARRLPVEAVRSARRVQTAGADRGLLPAPTWLSRLARAHGGARQPGRARLAAGIAGVASVGRLRVGAVVPVVAGLILTAPVVAGRVVAGPVLVGRGLAGYAGHAGRAVLAGRVLAGGAGLVLPAARAAGCARRPGLVRPGRVLAREAGLVRPGAALVGRIADRRAEDLRLLSQLGLSLRTA